MYHNRAVAASQNREADMNRGPDNFVFVLHVCECRHEHDISTPAFWWLQLEMSPQLGHCTCMFTFEVFFLSLLFLRLGLLCCCCRLSQVGAMPLSMQVTMRDGWSRWPLRQLNTWRC
jgi:hypothetical protein